MQALNQAYCCRCVPELYAALSSTGTTQWQLLQMVHATQLGVLLATGDFAALPMGTAPSDIDQVSAYYLLTLLNKCLWRRLGCFVCTLRDLPVCFLMMFVLLSY